jgi:hypothetical protein
MPGMALNLEGESGSLPPGRHRATVEEIKRTLVDAFPGSQSRAVIFEQWSMLLAAIERIVSVEAQWIDGSFVTTKEDPGDVDILSHLAGEALEALDGVDWTLLRGLIAGPLSRDLHLCDSYWVAIYPEGHPARGEYERALAYWDDWFGKDRAGNAKGYVELERDA